MLDNRIVLLPGKTATGTYTLSGDPTTYKVVMVVMSVGVGQWIKTQILYKAEMFGSNLCDSMVSEQTYYYTANINKTKFEIKTISGYNSTVAVIGFK